MQMKFKQTAVIDKKTYTLGVHEVPQKVMDHPHFAKFLKAGSIVPATATETIVAPTLAQKAASLKSKTEVMAKAASEKLKVSPVVRHDGKAQQKQMSKSN